MHFTVCGNSPDQIGIWNCWVLQRGGGGWGHESGQLDLIYLKFLNA